MTGTIARNDFAGQTAVTDATVGNSANSGTGFTAQTFDPTTSSQAYVADAGFSSGKGIELDHVAGEKNYSDFHWFNDPQASFSIEWKVQAAPTVDMPIGKICTALGICCSLYYTTTRKIKVVDSTGISTNIIYTTAAPVTGTGTGSVVDLQMNIVSATGTGGSFTLQVGPINNGAATQTSGNITGVRTLGGPVTTYRMGKPEATSIGGVQTFSNFRGIDGQRVIISTLNQYINGYQGQTDGVTVTSALTDNSGSALGTAPVQNAPGTIKFKADAAFAGSGFCIEVLPDTAQTCSYSIAFLNSTSVSAATWWKAPALPAADVVIIQLRTAGGNSAQITYTTLGKLRLTTGVAGTVRWTSAVIGTTGVVAVGSMWDIRQEVLSGATAAGSVALGIYAINSNTILESFALAGIDTVGGVITTVKWGKPGAAAGVVNAGRFGGQRVTDGTLARQDKFPSNLPPIANAGADVINIEPWASIPLLGTDSDVDGTVASREWMQLSGTPVVLSSTTTAASGYTAPGTIAGDTLVFGYQVTDDSDALSAVDQVSHTVLAATERQVVPTGPGEFMMGVSTTTTRGQTNQQSMDSTSAACGRQTIHRIYQGATYTDFTATSGAIDYSATYSTSLRTTHMSWNPLVLSLVAENTPNAGTQFSGFDPAGLQAYLADGDTAHLSGYGTETRKNIDFLRTVPAYHKVIFNPWHEADDNQTKVAYGGDGVVTPNTGAFRAAFRMICDMVHAFGNPNWQTCLLLMAYAWKGSSGSGNDPTQFWPCWPGLPDTGRNYVDIMGWDSYNEGGLHAAHGTNSWDSFGASSGVPYASEAANYQGRYGGTNGYKTTDTYHTWTNGPPGWCEAYGITKMLVGEIGTPNNFNGYNPPWLATAGISNSKADWIRNCVDFCSAWNGAHTSQFIALEYFMNAGRNYDGANYLDVSIHKATDGTLFSGILGEVANSAALPTVGVNIGDKYMLDSPKQIWRATATTPTWTNDGTYIQESWELWWNEDGSGWDDAVKSSYPGWFDANNEHSYSNLIEKPMRIRSVS